MITLVEFFCGMGGVSEAIRQFNSAHPLRRICVERAIEIDRDCGAVYQHNFGAVDCRSIDSMDLSEVATARSEQAWWLSPPCQPYCRRGRGAPRQDRRCDAIRAITHYLSHGDRVPSVVLLENVPEFATSEDAADLVSTLHRRGYATWSGNLCPTQFGIPNLRRRHYLIARRGTAEISPPMPPPEPSTWLFTIASILDANSEFAAELLVQTSTVDAYRGAMDLIDPHDELARAACFGSGYGKSLIRSGSYIQQGGRVRHFSPVEVARLLGFSSRYVFPDRIPMRRRWKMLGNSVSVPVVKTVLEAAFDVAAPRRCTR